MEFNKIYKGDCLETIKTFPDKSINCVITSPPYWQLRDYGWTGQWGLEKTFQEYLEHLWQLMDEVYRVLKDDGTCWINLGDTYSGSGGSGGDYNQNGLRDGQTKVKPPKQVLSKCLLLIPHRFAIGCIDRGWIMRNDIIWAKRNAMPESVNDRFSKKHEYFFFMTKSEDYYFDLDTIRDNHITNNKIRLLERGSQNWSANAKINGMQQSGSGGIGKNELGKNPGSVSDFWNITTKPSGDNHYASFNTELIDKPIIAGCPQYICKKCGKSRKNIIERKFNGVYNNSEGIETDCGCNAGFEGGIILDPFCGTATTGCRAIDLQRKFIGIEGKEEYVNIGNKKLHKYLVSQQLF